MINVECLFNQVNNNDSNLKVVKNGDKFNAYFDNNLHMTGVGDSEFEALDNLNEIIHEEYINSDSYKKLNEIHDRHRKLWNC